jgi:hypothetical protein
LKAAHRPFHPPEQHAGAYDLVQFFSTTWNGLPLSTVFWFILTPAGGFCPFTALMEGRPPGVPKQIPAKFTVNFN